MILSKITAANSFCNQTIRRLTNCQLQKALILQCRVILIALNCSVIREITYRMILKFAFLRSIQQARLPWTARGFQLNSLTIKGCYPTNRISTFKTIRETCSWMIYLLMGLNRRGQRSKKRGNPMCGYRLYLIQTSSKLNRKVVLRQFLRKQKMNRFYSHGRASARS